MDRPALLSASPQFDDLNYQCMRRFGVKMFAQGDQIVYRYVDEDTAEVLRSTNDEKGLNSAKAALEQFAKTIRAELESKYGVLFSDANDTFPQEVAASECQKQAGKNIPCREPRLSELAGIGAGLKDSLPSNRGAHGKAVKFYFLLDNLLANSVVAAHYLEDDGHGHNAVMFDYDSLQGRAPTRKENDWGSSMEDIVTHELAHGTQHNLAMGGNGQAAKYASSIGWTPYFDKTSQAQGWLLEGSQHELFSTGNACKTRSWTYVNKLGQPLDGPRGRVVDPSKAPHLDESFVASHARIKPASEYFTQPNEEHAEALKLFRLSAETRSALHESTPALYKVVKQSDQEEIDRVYGLTALRHSKLVRDLSGNLVANTRESRRAIKDAEASKLP